MLVSGRTSTGLGRGGGWYRDSRRGLPCRGSSDLEYAVCPDTVVKAYRSQFRLGKPASMLRRIVNGEPVPYSTTGLLAKQVSQRVAAVNVQIVLHQMDGFGCWICHRQFECDVGELTPGPGRRGKGEVPAGFGLYCAENNRRTASPVFDVPSCVSARRGGRSRTPSACRVTGFSSRQITGSFGLKGASYNSLHITPGHPPSS